jgi:hypothetical protein
MIIIHILWIFGPFIITRYNNIMSIKQIYRGIVN